MALDLDGFEAWRAIAGNPRPFAGVKAQATKKVRDFMAAFFKAKTTGLAEIRAAHDALDAQIFAWLVDGMKDSELKSLVGRLDRHHPDQKQADAEWRRRRLRDLASGSAEPVQKAPAKRGGRASLQRKAAAGATRGGKMRFSSAGAVRKTSRPASKRQA